jgi:Flp pilus assembly protein TadD
LTPLAYARTQPAVVLHYLRLAVWPHPLVLDYMWPTATTYSAIAPAAVVVGALLAATVWASWRRPEIGFLGVWFFGMLAPTSSVVPIQDLAVEHRMYLALASPIALAVLGGDALLRRLGRPGGRIAAAVLVAGVALALGWATMRRNTDYRSAVSIWQTVVSAVPRNFRAQGNLGAALQEQGRLEEAVEPLRRAIAIRPDYAFAHTTLGVVLARLGKLDEAAAAHEAAVRVRPDYVVARLNLASVRLERGELDAASAGLEAVRQLAPDDPDLHAKRGVLLLRRGRNAEAAIELERAVALRPTPDPDVHVNLAIAFLQQEMLDRAAGELDHAIRLAPSHAPAHANLGVVRWRQGDLGAAAASLERALAIAPDDASVHDNLGVVLLLQGDRERAAREFRSALRIAPGHVQAAAHLRRVEDGGAAASHPAPDAR